MSDSFIGEIKIVGFNFAPRSFAFCDGQILSIAQNTALFSLLGTNYGGNGQTTFGLPNLQNRAPVHEGAGHTIGEVGGLASHTLTPGEAAHTHVFKASANQGSTTSPTDNVLAAKKRGGKDIYHTVASAALHDSSVSSTAGGNQPHENRQPSLGLNFVICLVGVYPSRN